MKSTVQHLRRYKAIFSQKSDLSHKNKIVPTPSPELGVQLDPEVVQVQDSPSAFCLSWQFIMHLLQFSNAGLYLPHRACGFQQLLASLVVFNWLQLKKKKKGRKLSWVNLGHICLFPNQCLQFWDQVVPICLSSPSHHGWKRRICKKIH